MAPFTNMCSDNSNHDQLMYSYDITGVKWEYYLLKTIEQLSGIIIITIIIIHDDDD